MANEAIRDLIAGKQAQGIAGFGPGAWSYKR